MSGERERERACARSSSVARSAGGIFVMQKMQIPFLLDVLCFFFPLENLSQFLQEVQGDRESWRIFSSSSKLLFFLRLWQATNRENSARIEDVQVCVVTC